MQVCLGYRGPHKCSHVCLGAWEGAGVRLALGRRVLLDHLRTAGRLRESMHGGLTVREHMPRVGNSQVAGTGILIVPTCQSAV